MWSTWIMYHVTGLTTGEEKRLNNSETYLWNKLVFPIYKVSEGYSACALAILWALKQSVIWGCFLWCVLAWISLYLYCLELTQLLKVIDFCVLGFLLFGFGFFWGGGLPNLRNFHLLFRAIPFQAHAFPPLLLGLGRYYLLLLQFDRSPRLWQSFFNLFFSSFLYWVIFIILFSSSDSFLCPAHSTVDPI